MTQIDFYTHAGDKLETARRLAVKAFRHTRRITVFCPDANVARQFSHLLWATPPGSFIPHCGAGDPLAPVTPVIVDHEGADPLHDEILLNLRPEWPPLFSRFQRLIEVVSLDDEDCHAARERFRFYRDRGYAIRTHNLSEADR